MRIVFSFLFLVVAFPPFARSMDRKCNAFFLKAQEGTQTPSAPIGVPAKTLQRGQVIVLQSQPDGPAYSVQEQLQDGRVLTRRMIPIYSDTSETAYRLNPTGSVRIFQPQRMVIVLGSDRLLAD